MIGLPPRTVLAFTNADGSESLPLKSGDIDRTFDACRASLVLVAAAVATGDVASHLEGPKIEPVFRRA